MSPLLKNLVIALGITVVLAGAYYLTKETDVTGTGETVMANAEAAEKSAEIQRDKAAIEQYNLESRLVIFQDKRFTSLVNTHQEPAQIQTGRDNPFAPIR